MKLDPIFIDEQKKRLIASKESIEKELEDLKKFPDMGDDIDSFGEETDEAEAYANNLAEIDALKKDLGYIIKSLAEIKNGTYGICRRCGKLIDKEILVAAPESHDCQECKMKRSYREDQ